MRFYGFEVNEIVNEKHPNLDLDVDPKLSWALRHPEQFPVDLNRADYQMILRVPGIGVKSAKKIVQARRFGKIHIDLLKNSVWPTNEQNSLFAVKTVQNSKRIVFKFYSAADFNARLIEICAATLATIKPWVLAMFNEEVAYYFDGSMVGLLSCVFRAFQFKELQVRLCLNDAAQHGLFADKIEVANNEQHAERVWSALQKSFHPLH